MSRTIRGLPDEDIAGWLKRDSTSSFRLWNSDPACNQEAFKVIADNRIDLLPDVFSYQVGEHQNTFIFTRDKRIMKTLRDDVLFVMEPSSSFGSFVLTDVKGNTYRFNGNQASMSVDSKAQNGGESTTNLPRSGNGVNEWKLGEITTKNNKDIDFTYELYQFTYHNNNSEVHRTYTIPYIQTTETVFNTNYDVKAFLISKIETSKVRINFSYEVDNNADIWKKKLTQLVIYDKLTGDQKKYIFEYDLYPVCNQLRLRSLKEIENDMLSEGKIWRFNYNTDSVPKINSCDFDFFGYYNNKGNKGYVPLTYQSNGSFFVKNHRDIDDTAIQNGVLNEIIYPTGGKTKFYYEPNKDINAFGKTYYAPGIRVKRIEDIDNQSNVNTVEYVYSGLTGNIRIDDENKYNKFFMESEIHNKSIVFYSSERDLVNEKSGYCYTTVETRYLDGNTIKYKEIRNYNPFELNHTIYPRLSQVKYFDESNNIKKRIRYSYSTINTTVDIKAWRLHTKLKNNILVTCGNSAYYADEYYEKVCEDYKYDLNSSLFLSYEETAEFFDNDSLINSKSFAYDYNTLQLNFLSHTSSIPDRNYAVEYIYPSQSLYSNLFNKNMVGLPVIITKHHSTRLPPSDDPIPRVFEPKKNYYDKLKYDYDDNGNITCSYDFVNDSSVNYLKLNNQYTYNQNYKITETKQRDGLIVSYLWSYNNEFPVVEIVSNQTYNTIKGIVGEQNIINLSNKSNPTLSEINTLINPLKTNEQTKNALVTIYTYKPLVGMTSKTDSRGVTTYYEYDGFGRLEAIKDNDGKIIQRFDYHYKL